MTEITQLIAQCLREGYGLEIAELELLLLGADQNASVYRAEGNDRKVYFVKVRRGPFSKGHLQVMSLLQKAGVKEIIPPIRTKEGQGSGAQIYRHFVGIFEPEGVVDIALKS